MKVGEEGEMEKGDEEKGMKWRMEVEWRGKNGGWNGGKGGLEKNGGMEKVGGMEKNGIWRREVEWKSRGNK